jgi:uncharacterized membrane protein YbhN (UPF0104 family)
LLKLFPVAFYVLLAIFLAVYIQRLDWSQLDSATVYWPYVAVATLLAIVFRYYGAFIWFVLLKSLGAKDLRKNTWQLLYVYAKSWLGRYIPGKAPWILGKIYFASKLGVSKNKLAVSSLLEGALQIVVTLAIAIAILLFDPRLDVVDQNFKVLIVAVLVGCVVALIPGVFNRIISVSYRLFKKKAFLTEHMASQSTVLRGAGLYVLGAIVGGLSFFFIAKAVYAPLGYEDILFVLGVSNLASAVSMLAVFTPSGLGVREGIQVVLLSLIMPVEFAILIAVVTRLWSVAVDFVFFGLAGALRNVK